jgi:hypothetical protein
MFGGLLGACSGEGIARAVHGADGIEPVEHADFLPNEDYTREVFSYWRKEFGQTRDYCILPDDHCAGFALPWDQVRPFTKRGWERLCGVLGPRDTNRGLRGGI